MKKCWCTSPEDRPSFSTILKQLEEFHKNCAVLLTDYIVPVQNTSPNQDGKYRKVIRNGTHHAGLGHFVKQIVKLC